MLIQKEKVFCNIKRIDFTKQYPKNSVFRYFTAHFKAIRLKEASNNSIEISFTTSSLKLVKHGALIL